MSDITIPVLPADLPEDFKMQDIIAPNGADVGKSPQHGYNYLMQQMNETQRAVMKMAEDANSALENKVNDTIRLGDNIDNLLKHKSTVFASLPATQGFPDGDWYIGFSASDGGMSRAIIVIDSSSIPPKAYFKTYINGIPTEWQKIATAAPPQKHDLTFAPGFSTKYRASLFWKNQFGECTITARCSSTETIVFGQAIAILPEGFHPVSLESSLCSIKYNSGDVVTGHVDVAPIGDPGAGQIRIFPYRLLEENAVDIIINPIQF